jgi:hypothetical protein
MEAHEIDAGNIEEVDILTRGKRDRFKARGQVLPLPLLLLSHQASHHFDA